MSKLAWLVITIGGAVICLAACSPQPTPAVPAITPSTATLTPAPSTPPSLSNTNTRPAPTGTPTVLATPTFTATVNLAPRQIGNFGQGMVTGIYRSPDGKLLLYVAAGHLHFVDPINFADLGIIPFIGDPVSAIYFSPDSQLAGVALYGGSVAIIDLSAQRIIATMKVDGIGNGVEFTPDHHFAVSTAITCCSVVDSQVVVWDVSQDKLAMALTSPTQEINEVYSPPALSPAGELVAAGASGLEPKFGNELGQAYC